VGGSHGFSCFARERQKLQDAFESHSKERAALKDAFEWHSKGRGALRDAFEALRRGVARISDAWESNSRRLHLEELTGARGRLPSATYRTRLPRDIRRARCVEAHAVHGVSSA
jgi:hypothetical protein